MKLKERIISLLQSTDYVPLDLVGIAKALDLKKKDQPKLEHEVREMLGKGELTRIKKDRYCVPNDADLATGKIHFRQSGSAIVVPEAGPDRKRTVAINISAEDTGVAMHGDQVVIRFYDERDRPRQSHRGPKIEGRWGRVIRILKRARSTIVGNLQRTRLFHFVVPDDPRLIHDIYVPDPEDSDVTPKPKVGSKVVVELHPWEQRHVNPEGEIIKCLGSTHEPGAELSAIFHKYELDLDFPSAVLEEAKAVSQNISKKQLEGRLDIRDRFTLTIDPDDAKDFDDALSVENLPNGDLRIGVHIADVASYVRPGTHMDAEAQRRGNSTYLVGVVIPMLPHELSSGICSLKEDVDRLTKSVFLTFSPKGQLKETDFYNTVIRSNKRLTYKQAYTLLFNDDLEVARKFKAPPAHQTGFSGRPLSELDDKELKRIQAAIRQLWGVASKIRRERMAGGSLDLDMVETKIFVDEQGYADRLEKIVNDESHQLIEEFMLAANQAIAKGLRYAKLPCVYRSHDQPDDEKLVELRDYLGTFDIHVGDLSLRQEIVKALKLASDHPQSHILKTQVLRSLKKACYTATPDGHYGLNMANYAHFTSPIRRYSDLIVHRIFETFVTKFHGRPDLSGETPRYAASKATSLAEHLSLTEVNSTEAERESIKIKLLEYFERELNKPEKTKFEAVITEIRNHGMFIELVESSAFGMIHVSTLRDDMYHISPDGGALVGRRTKNVFETGQTISVEVERVDRFKRQIDFRVAGGAKKGRSGGDAKSSQFKPSKKGKKPLSFKGSSKRDGSAKPTKKKAGASPWAKAMGAKPPKKRNRS